MNNIINERYAPVNDRHIWVELTNKCNLSCVHCYNSSSPTADESLLSLDDYFHVINSARDADCNSVQFIGGEPTTSPHLIPLLRGAKDIGFGSIEVFTNLYSIRDEIISTIVEAGARVATSFYSYDEVTHDRITGKFGSYDKVSANIVRLLELGLDVRVGFIEMSVNQDHYEMTVEYLHTLGVNNIGMDKIRGFGRAKEPDVNDDLSELCGKCGGSNICVSWDGSITPCIMSKSWPIGNIKDISLPDALSSATLLAFRDKLSERPVVRADCNPECAPNCTPTCSPRCGPSCSPCFPYGRCRPAVFG